MVQFVALFASLAIATVSAYRPGDEVCIVSPDNACPLDKLTLSQTDASTLIYPGGKTRCAFDNFSSNDTLYKTNATYFFQVFPKPEKKKLLLYFQQGGGCTEDQTCNFATQCSLPVQTFQPNAMAKSAGVLNASDPLNLFHDWNIVHVPYCTGDLHVGKNKTSAVDQPFIFSNEACNGKNIEMHMNGYENSMSALNWAVANYPHPEQLVLSGSSAGALGAQLMAEMVAKLWKVEETKTKFSVLADSYVGVIPESRTGGELINYLGACELPLGFSSEVVANCKQNQGTVIAAMQSILKDTVFSDWLHIDSKADRIQRYFTTLYEVGIDKVLFTNKTSPDHFWNQMNVIIAGEREASTRISTFFVEGERHMFLQDNEWYTALRADTNETLGSFVQTWLEHTEPEQVASVPTLPTSGSVVTTGSTVLSVVLSIVAMLIV